MDKRMLCQRAIVLLMVFTFLLTAGCGSDSPSFFIGDQKVYYTVPQNFTELKAQEEGEMLGSVRNMLASSGLVLAACFVRHAQADAVATQANALEEYSVIAFIEATSFGDMSSAGFQELISEIEGFDDAMLARTKEKSLEILKEAKGIEGNLDMMKPKLMGKSSDRATFYQQVGGNFNAENKDVRILMTFVHLGRKSAIVYHYHPVDPTVSRDDLYQKHLKLLKDLDLRAGR